MQEKFKRKYLFAVIGLAMASAFLLVSFQFPGIMRGVFATFGLFLLLIAAIYLAYVVFSKPQTPKE